MSRPSTHTNRGRAATSEIVYFGIPTVKASAGACKCGADCKCASGDKSACKCGADCSCPMKAAGKCPKAGGCKATADGSCSMMAAGKCAKAGDCKAKCADCPHKGTGCPMHKANQAKGCGGGCGGGK